MKLTKRQDTFIKNLLDLYLDTQEPIHYTVLADRLGVSRFTAYDMLRVLEDKGFVKSEYRLSDESKLGRSERLFIPTEIAHKLISAITTENKKLNWEAIKDRVLELIQNGEFNNLDIGPELLARVPPESEDSIQYCIEVVTSMALHARKHDIASIMQRYIIELIPSKPLTHKAYLSLLSGFALGVIAFSNQDDNEWVEELIPHVITFQEYILEFNEAQCRQLADGIREHFAEMFIFLPNEGLDIDQLDKIKFIQEK